jgi:serine phosphatase RsbU (regulator of sigma subunit)
MSKNGLRLIFVAIVFFNLTLTIKVQGNEFVALTAENFSKEQTFDLSKSRWKYRSGDQSEWAARDLDESDWRTVEATTLTDDLMAGEWGGRGWFRLHLRVDENLANQTFALIGTQRGATEIYLDGRRIAEFGKITETEISEYNPTRLPIPFRFDGAGEHILAVRFATQTFADSSSKKYSWLTSGGIYPGFTYSLSKADDVAEVISNYSFGNSMRIGFFFIGVLLALALLHFLLYVFYSIERANLFYSIYAASFGLFLLFNNLISFGHQPILVSVILRVITSIMLAATFTGLLTFLHIAFGRRFGKLFWLLTGLWIISLVIGGVFLNNAGKYQLLTSLNIALSFTFSIVILVNALRTKRAGAWILMVGVQILMLGMLSLLLSNSGVFTLSGLTSLFAELAIILGVPVAVSVFLARNFARTNRDLKTQLAQVETLSNQKIEHERTSAELRAENERRMKELEEARQLQLSMLPKKLPQISGLEIAAYMKPASEVGGDYYDFHEAVDGTLTVAVGDATGHGLKAGTVVTATKSLFNAFAGQTDIPQIFTQVSGALKKMNLRGLFMAMAMLKIKDSAMSLCVAGMPSVLIYRADVKTVEEISVRAMPLGSVTKSVYQERKISLLSGDCVVLMSDGFPEMFNAKNEMLGFEKAAEMLPQIAMNSPQEIINQFVKVGEQWANGRPQDDDVTFVVLKFNVDTSAD